MERKTVSRHFPAAFIFMIQDTQSEAEKNKSDVHQNQRENLSLLVTLVASELKSIRAGHRVVSEAICETPVLVFTRTADLMEVATHENVSKVHAYTMAKGIKDGYPDRPFSFIIAGFSKVSINLPKTRQFLKSRTRRRTQDTLLACITRTAMEPR